MADTDPTVEEKYATSEKNKDEPTFFQIRKQFEEKSRVMKATAPANPVASPDSDCSEFQNLYPSFKKHFTKRQFAALQCCFRMADRNQDGFLEPKEIKQLLVDHKQSINLCDADIIVSMGDHDEDGKLSPKEFLELCEPTAEIIREQQHMEGSSCPPDQEFVDIVIQRLRSFVTPINSQVKGARKFFENIISGGKCDPGNGKMQEPTPMPRKSRARMVPPRRIQPPKPL